MNVAIIGGGVAGSVTALELAKGGASVTVIERDASVRWKIGEGLPPAAKPLLQQLGVWERFLADNHLASYGNCSAWGSSKLVDQSFVFNPYGNGWHLDRSRFDQLLLSAAIEAGARFVSDVGQVQNLSHQIENLQTLARLVNSNVGQVQNLSDQIEKADFIVDASGRSSWFARRQGAQRISVDNLVAVAALLTTDGDSEDQDSLTMVEAVAEGWWYAALLPSEKLVAVYLSDADLDSTRLAGTTEGWLKLLGETQRLRARIERRSYRIELEPRIVSANSSRLDRVAGDSWLAVGDAAAAFDPLSSQGIVTAMEFGILAAQAILAGSPEALIAYSQRLERGWDAYLNNRNLYYSQERRWPESTFWVRRNSVNQTNNLQPKKW